MPDETLSCRRNPYFRPLLATNTMTKDSSGSRRFAIALSFPGEHRDYVKQVAVALLPAFGGVPGKDRVFYDAWHESKVIGYGSNRKLQKIYAEDSDLIVPFYCQDYLKKNWCGVELRAIENLLFAQEYERVLPFRFDMVDIPSSFKTDVFPVVTERSPKDIARLILERYNEIANTSLELSEAPGAHVPIDISRIDKYAPAQLIGRDDELKLLNDAWAMAQANESKRPRILTFVALGGEGKTSLVAKWAADLAYQNWPGCEAVFAWSFYSQGTREQVAASSDVFLKEALTFFGDPEMAGSALSAYEKGRRLAQLVNEQRALLILDGLEPLQYAPTSPTAGELKDQGLSALLKGLAANNKGLCVVTTRTPIPDLRAYWQTTAPEVELLRLSKEAGIALLRSLGVNGRQEEFETLVEVVKGHALTMNLLGTYLRDAHAGDIRKRDLVNLEEADEERGGHAFRVMDAYVRWFEGEDKHGKRALALLRILGLFDRPADIGCLKAVWKAPGVKGLTEPLAGISEAKRNIAMTRLERARLLTVNRDPAGNLLSLDAHPLLREYFFASSTPRPGTPPTGGSSSTSARQQRKGSSPHSKICNPFTRPWRMVARRGSSRKRVPIFIAAGSCVETSSTARENSAH